MPPSVSSSSSGLLMANNGNIRGYWGDITSSVDWCEENYEIHSLILPSCRILQHLFVYCRGTILGEVGARMNCTGYIGFTVMSRIITLVGVGSFLFHATLKYHTTQMLDEIPMLWAILCTFYIQTKLRYIKSPLFLYATIFWGCFITFLTAGFEGKTQFVLFHISFSSFGL